MFWQLRNGQYIRVILNIDPCWNKKDVMKAGNLYVKFISSGYDESEARSLASAAIWKEKWPGTVYSSNTECVLNKVTNDLSKPL